MKIHPDRKQEGSAVIVVIAILALMLMLSTANHRILKVLHGEVQLLERQQIKNLERMQTQPAVTNAQVSAFRSAEILVRLAQSASPEEDKNVHTGTEVRPSVNGSN